MGKQSLEHYKKLGEKFSSRKEGFVLKAKTVHGDMYDYSKVNYINNKTKVEIICPEHGSFEQRPDNHTNLKQECPKCRSEKQSVRQKKDTEEVLEGFKKVHGLKFCYSKVNYTGSISKVIIICPKHGEFKQSPSCHLSGKSCQKCYDERRRKLTPELRKLYQKIKCLIGNSYAKRKYTKRSRVFEILGCTWGYFKQHLEDNPYGFKINEVSLDLDHIIPKSKAKTEKELLELNHYSNFQLLPSEYNRNIKRDKKFSAEHFKNWLTINKKQNR